ncbi:MAG TPA: rod shape-determining protein MreC [Acidiphilium sp.]|nr:MAG: rod shape-determining protein MreC [Acidiphilium sp. 21-60-14]OYV90457.1 MAG: rod shape-determining protein MreC [Acidiphilium sp. 37-60-79]OZB38829.1 MAG: rod shape-determining protein MreC [Acidiphilium sp. 34-60-192]HQT87734.1 rod shape-determining protein MreC [Acidiphilium sp.]HQU22861.1 rod shape-determining protein MreC [Acidiphilium sp.]
MFRLSVPARLVLARLTLPVMLLLALGLMIAGRANGRLTAALRLGLDDALTPAFRVMSRPMISLTRDDTALGAWVGMHRQILALRAENARLRRWQSVALALAAQNQALKSALHFVPTPTPEFFTARVIADNGGLYARSVLVSVPSGAPNLIDAIAMDGRGVVGRVVQSGLRSARVLLINDLNSRVPVAMGAAGAHALMVGTNGAMPSLQYWSPNHPPHEGEIVLTSAAGGVFPPGLPVGVVHYQGRNNPVVLPFAGLHRLQLLRLFDYHAAGQSQAQTATDQFAGNGP